MVEKFFSLELEICLLLNRLCAFYRLRQFFKIISRLGDGLFWYSLMLALPVFYGQDGFYVSSLMLVTSIVGLLLYKLIKTYTERPRPYAVSNQINLGTAPLDRYSFPSGHTLHAVSFTLIVVYFYPHLAWLLFPFVLLIALSRVLLGLHYPTDVAAGAVIGATLATITISI